MNCPACGQRTVVEETRQRDDGIRRRRSCKCGHAFTTVEVTVPFRRGYCTDIDVIARLVPLPQAYKGREDVEITVRAGFVNEEPQIDWENHFAQLRRK